MLSKICWIGILSIMASGAFANEESLPPLKDGEVPQNLNQLWSGYDPCKEPLAIEIVKQWEQGGAVCRVVRYQVGVFKGAPAKVAAFYAFPKGATKLPGLVQIHGGGQAANLDCAITDAKRGYASISINWGGNKLNFGRTQTNYDGPNTDWGKLDATHPPQRNKVNHFAGPVAPDNYTLDAVESPRNSNWFLVLIAARRAVTFLQQQPEVDAARIGIYGHSMGGKLTTDLAGIDKRVKAAVPSCGGAGNILDSQADVPGCIKTKPTALELACIADNRYLERITCPVLWLSPTNDFNAPIDNMAFNWRNLPDDLVRFSIAPHLNHRHTDEHAITQHLWFEQHLKRAFTMPRTPQIELNLKTSDGIPVITVDPDGSKPIQRVDIYYSPDPHVLTRFWRDARAVKDGQRWRATCPIMSLEQPLFAYANVSYELPTQYRKLEQVPGQDQTEAFVLSSRVVAVTPAQLRAAGVKVTDGPERMIDDGARGWHDWYRLNWAHPPLWCATTRKLKDSKWRGPDGAKLVFEVICKQDNRLVVKFNCNAWGAFLPGKPAIDYAVAKPLKGSDDWQTVSVSLGELSATDPKFTAPLANWQAVTEFSISPSGDTVEGGQKVRIAGRPWQGPRELRNLRWDGGEYSSQRTRDSASSAEEHQRQFNDAIKKSLDQK